MPGRAGLAHEAVTDVDQVLGRELALQRQPLDRDRLAIAAVDGPVPNYPSPDGVKLAAGWLVERAGFGKGYPGDGAPARLSTKHALAVTNRGTATTAELLALAREVRDGVRRAFGISLVPEPILVGCEL